MKVTLQYGLPYVKVSLTFRRHQLTLENILLDTGSAGTIFSADKVAAAGIQMEPEDSIHRLWLSDGWDLRHELFDSSWSSDRFVQIGNRFTILSVGTPARN